MQMERQIWDKKKCSLPFSSQAVLLSFAATEVLFKSRPHLTG